MTEYKIVHTLKELNKVTEEGFGFVEALDPDTWLVVKHDDSIVFTTSPRIGTGTSTTDKPIEELVEPPETSEDTTETAPVAVIVPSGSTA